MSDERLAAGDGRLEVVSGTVLVGLGSVAVAFAAGAVGNLAFAETARGARRWNGGRSGSHPQPAGSRGRAPCASANCRVSSGVDRSSPSVAKNTSPGAAG